jgi:hypothetical protein
MHVAEHLQRVAYAPRRRQLVSHTAAADDDGVHAMLQFVVRDGIDAGAQRAHLRRHALAQRQRGVHVVLRSSDQVDQPRLGGLDPAAHAGQAGVQRLAGQLRRLLLPGRAAQEGAQGRFGSRLAEEHRAREGAAIPRGGAEGRLFT